MQFSLIGLTTFTSKKGNPCYVAHISVPCNRPDFQGEQVLTPFVSDTAYKLLDGRVGDRFNGTVTFAKGDRPAGLCEISEVE